MNWLELLHHLDEMQESAMLVCVSRVKGSTPREIGAAMLVTATQCKGTIGGGHLEYTAIEIARSNLTNIAVTKVVDVAHGRIESFPLGAGLGQCCGGMVELFFQPVLPKAVWVRPLLDKLTTGQACSLLLPIERNNISQQIEIPLQYDAIPVVIFGAGHVGMALVRAMAPLPCSIIWIDERVEMFSPALLDSLPSNVETICCDSPEAEVAAAIPESYFLVMTHSHALDQRLCAAILQRDDFAYLGVIGSTTKRLSFEHRLSARGFSREQLARITCPIGLMGIRGKAPEIVALAVAAEIMLLRSSRKEAKGASDLVKDRVDVYRKRA